ncbi:MAG TPA: type II secretion system F family protein, partial [Ilumatobacteraceae bacterium]
AFRSVTESSEPPFADALRHCVRRMDIGDGFAAGISELPASLGPLAQPLADALALSDRYGTPLAATLDRLADEARAQRRRAADATARQLPIKLSFPLVGCTLPAFVLLTIVPLMAGTLSSLQTTAR